MYIASRDEKSLKEAADEFNSKGYPGKCVPLTANLASYEGVIGLVQELEKREKCESELSWLFIRNKATQLTSSETLQACTYSSTTAATTGERRKST